MENYQMMMFNTQPSQTPPYYNYDHYPQNLLPFSTTTTSDNNNNNIGSLHEFLFSSNSNDEKIISSQGGGLIKRRPEEEGEEEEEQGGMVKKMKKKVRREKYAFQTRSQVDILDDGYRWRKYGQKSVKNNKFPRSYYRCTHQGCSVKKQVQRLSKDEGVVVTTYEGIHTHPIQKSNDNFEHILSQMQIYSGC
ncbi:putative WRKY transcription factor 75 [Acorus gramineus]|uniref:WRKY transcription factor 75 n=1 Tax=Acorus gramineus TaxID=55184 RepID=A0AAV9B157_ACOGR|nr:putative WRKY transcription factor 75 [Acorus gramineus]